MTGIADVVRTRLLFGSVVLVLSVVAGCSKSDDTDPTANCGPATDEPPAELACTGLYTDFRSRSIAPTARFFAPAVALWSDGYDKSRYIALPDGAPIDASAVDDWKFPVGTKVWKEFGRKGRKIETRLLWKVSADKWTQAAYVWAEDGSSATRAEGKDLTIDGAAYHVPTVIECTDCHRGRKDELLGFEAISLAQGAAQGVTLAVLAQENRLNPPPAKTALTIDPGLATLHVNCGVSCHNSTPGAKGSDSTLRLRIAFDEVASKPANTWDIATTTVGVRTTLPGWNGGLRVAPGSPEKSVLVTAMSTLGTGQMPPMMSEIDFAGVAAVSAWVRSLTP